MLRRFQRLDLKWKLMIPFVLLTFLWAASGTFLITRQAIDRAGARAENELREDMFNVGSRFADLVAAHIELVRLASHTEGMRSALIDGDRPGIDRLARPLFLNSRAETMVVASSSDEELLQLWRASSDTSFALGPEALRLIREEIRGQEATHKVVMMVDSTQGPLLIAAGPVMRGQEQVGTVIVGTLARTFVHRLFPSLGDGMAVFGPSGQRVASAGDVRRIDPAVLRAPDATKQVIDGYAVLVGSLQARGYIVAKVGLFRRTDSLVSEVRRTAGGLIGVGLAAIFGVIGLGVFTARAITSPLARVAETARSIAGGDLSQRAHVRGGDEIGTLGAAFNQMADRLQTLYADLEARVEARTDELTRTNQELERVARAKSEFLANMSHELRTPLNAIIGYSELLSDPSFGPLKPGEVRKQARAIHSSGMHLLDLINDVLDLAKIESGKLMLHVEDVALKKVIKDSVELMRPDSDAKGLKLRVRLAKAPESVRADEKRLRQILLNLISNAVKFTPEAGSVIVEAASTATGVAVSVIDTGIGIRPEFQEQIFEQFIQVDGSYGRKQQGTGLGLALTRQLVELHGGTITVESEEDKGSRFTFTIPTLKAVAKIREAS